MEVSFTDEATFKSDGSPGWYVRRSRSALCIQPDTSEIKVRTTVPNETFTEVFEAQVKDDAADAQTMFSRAKSDAALDPLRVAPNQVQIRAVYVSKFHPDTRCNEASAVRESSPTGFAGGTP